MVNLASLLLWLYLTDFNDSWRLRYEFLEDLNPQLFWEEGEEGESFKWGETFGHSDSSIGPERAIGVSKAEFTFFFRLPLKMDELCCSSVSTERVIQTSNPQLLDESLRETGQSL